MAAADLAAARPRVLAPFEFRITTSAGGQKLLRFTTVIVNIGPGPFQLYGYDEDGAAKIGDTLGPPADHAHRTGPASVRDTTATMFWAGDGHNHFHVDGLPAVRDPDSSTARRPSQRREDRFCFLDSYRYGSTLAGLLHVGRSTSASTAPNGQVPMGISRRWGDIYRSTIAFQWIDITGLPSGDYRIKVIADPPRKTGGRFLEVERDEQPRLGEDPHHGKSSVTVLCRSAKP